MGNQTVADEESRDVEQAPEPDTRPLHSVFTKNEKTFIATMASFGAFFSPLSSQIYLPALPAITKELQITPELANLTITMYVVLQAVAPTFMGNLADTGGRRPIYILCFVLYMASCIGIALNHSYAGLMVLRCLQSAGSSSTVALAYGVIADLYTSSQRGTFMSLVSVGALLGPALGPVIGGLLSQYLGWRWIFWFLTILAGVYLGISVVFFPETARNVVGNGSIPPPLYNMSLLSYYKSRGGAPVSHKNKFEIPNPLRVLKIIVEKDAAILLSCGALLFGGFYCVLSTIPQIFAELYALDDLQIGLCFIPFGIGAMIASVLNGRLFNVLYRRVAKQHGITVDHKRGDDMRKFPIEKARLPIVVPFVYLAIVVILIYGWILEIKAPLAAPLVLLFFLGLFVVGANNAMNTLLIDMFPDTPATASAASNLVRCAIGAAATAIITIILEKLGRGWGFTLVAGILLVASPAPFALIVYGPKWREERYLRNENKRQKIAAEETAKG